MGLFICCGSANAVAENKNGNSVSPHQLLIQAAKNGNASALSTLLFKDEQQKQREILDLRYRDIESSWTALHWAAHEGHDKIVDMLLNRAQQQMQLPQDRQGDPELLQYLISATDGRGWTALHMACHQGKTAVVQRLLTVPSSIRVPVDARTKEGKMTPLHLAMTQGDYREIVQLVLDYHNNSASNAQGSTLSTHSANSSSQNEDTNKNESKTTTKLATMPLIESRADGMTLLHWASYLARIETVEYLLREANPKADLTATADNNGMTALHLASRKKLAGTLQVVETLIDWGADVFRPDGQGRTPLHHASHKGHLKTVQVLLDCGADVQAKDAQSKRPLDLAQARLDEMAKGESGADSGDDGGTDDAQLEKQNAWIEIVGLLRQGEEDLDMAAIEAASPTGPQASTSAAQGKHRGKPVLPTPIAQPKPTKASKSNMASKAPEKLSSRKSHVRTENSTTRVGIEPTSTRNTSNNTTSKTNKTTVNGKKPVSKKDISARTSMAMDYINSHVPIHSANDTDEDDTEKDASQG